MYDVALVLEAVSEVPNESALASDVPLPLFLPLLLFVRPVFLFIPLLEFILESGPVDPRLDLEEENERRVAVPGGGSLTPSSAVGSKLFKAFEPSE